MFRVTTPELKREGTRSLVNSNEIAEADALPLCFSLLAQMTLGVVKCMRSGRAYIPDCEGELQLYEVKGSRLRAVCVSEFATAEEAERSKSVGVKTETFSPEYTRALRMSTEVAQEEDPATDDDDPLKGRAGRFGTPLGERTRQIN